jgi:pantothenate kinase type III
VPHEGLQGEKLVFTFRIAYMREIDNKSIQVNWIPLVRSRGLVEMAVMAVMISPVKEIAPLPLLIYGIRQEFITVLRRAQKWPRLNQINSVCLLENILYKI